MTASSQANGRLSPHGHSLSAGPQSLALVWHVGASLADSRLWLAAPSGSSLKGAQSVAPAPVSGEENRSANLYVYVCARARARARVQTRFALVRSVAEIRAGVAPQGPALQFEMDSRGHRSRCIQAGDAPSCRSTRNRNFGNAAVVNTAAPTHRLHPIGTRVALCQQVPEPPTPTAIQSALD